jgi:hypothetical protein
LLCRFHASLIFIQEYLAIFYVDIILITILAVDLAPYPFFKIVKFTDILNTNIMSLVRANQE